MNIACIGSREISKETEFLMYRIGKYIVQKKSNILSGNADGSDCSYAKGGNSIDPTAVHLYLPWRSYNQEKKYEVKGNLIIVKDDPEWTEIAAEHHPAWAKLTQGTQKMMIRNAGIVTNSQKVIAYLNHKKQSGGGTGHGWRIAMALGIPALDISLKENQEPAVIKEFLELE